MQVVARPLDAESKKAADGRAEVLNAALAAVFGSSVGGAQSELHRLLVEAGERNLSLQTVNKWCRGKSPMTEMTLRGVLTVLGLDADWRPAKASPNGSPAS